MDISKILDLASHVLTVVVLVLSGCAWFFRHAISEWIKSRFAREVGKELAHQAYQFNRDLELYKGSLLQELEQFRANIDIRRSIMLKTADTRLEALRSLAYALDLYSTECLTWPTLTPDLRKRNTAELLDATKAVRNAKRAAGIFLPSEVNLQIASTLARGSELVGKFAVADEAVLQSGDEQISSVMTVFGAAMNTLRAQIDQAPAQLL